jgi:hypothetical protein
MRAHNVGSGGGGRSNNDQEDDELPELDISSIYQKDIDKSYDLISQQLFVTDNINTLQQHLFCRIRLHSIDKRRPTEMFGRIISCRPSVTNIKNAQRIELLFPRAKLSPGLVVIEGKEIDYVNHALLETSLIKIHIWGDGQDFSHFEGYEKAFNEKGFAPVTSYSTDEFLDSASLPRSHMPWFYIIGSGWLEQQAHKEVYTYRAVRSAIEKVIQTPYRTVINFYSVGQSMIINDLFNYSTGITEFFSYEARGFQRALDIAESKFDQLIRYPLNTIAQQKKKGYQTWIQVDCITSLRS